jgi:uncharacterized membrane protein YhhN
MFFVIVLAGGLASYFSKITQTQGPHNIRDLISSLFLAMFVGLLALLLGNFLNLEDDLKYFVIGVLSFLADKLLILIKNMLTKKNLKGFLLKLLS